MPNNLIDAIYNALAVNDKIYQSSNAYRKYINKGDTGMGPLEDDYIESLIGGKDINKKLVYDYIKKHKGSVSPESMPVKVTWKDVKRAIKGASSREDINRSKKLLGRYLQSISEGGTNPNNILNKLKASGDIGNSVLQGFYNALSTEGKSKKIFNPLRFSSGPSVTPKDILFSKLLLSLNKKVIKPISESGVGRAVSKAKEKLYDIAPIAKQEGEKIKNRLSDIAKNLSLYLSSKPAKLTDSAKKDLGSLAQYIDSGFKRPSSKQIFKANLVRSIGNKAKSYIDDLKYLKHNLDAFLESRPARLTNESRKGSRLLGGYRDSNFKSPSLHQILKSNIIQSIGSKAKGYVDNIKSLKRNLDTFLKSKPARLSKPEGPQKKTANYRPELLEALVMYPKSEFAIYKNASDDRYPPTALRSIQFNRKLYKTLGKKIPQDKELFWRDREALARQLKENPNLANEIYKKSLTDYDKRRMATNELSGLKKQYEIASKYKKGKSIFNTLGLATPKDILDTIKGYIWMDATKNRSAKLKPGPVDEYIAKNLDIDKFKKYRNSKAQ